MLSYTTSPTTARNHSACRGYSQSLTEDRNQVDVLMRGRAQSSLTLIAGAFMLRMQRDPPEAGPKCNVT